MPHIRGPRSAFVSFKCPKKEIQFARRWSALAMPHGHALIKKKEKAQKKKKKKIENVVPKQHRHKKLANWRRLQPAIQTQIQNWRPWPWERVENKNFYLNGKNQQMQRKTI